VNFQIKKCDHEHIPIAWWLGEILTWFARPKTITHPSTNRCGRESNSRPSTRKSSVIASGPPSHRVSLVPAKSFHSPLTSLLHRYPVVTAVYVFRGLTNRVSYSSQEAYTLSTGLSRTRSLNMSFSKRDAYVFVKLSTCRGALSVRPSVRYT